tara:strand:- start:966 stop:1505 length:540 start_codon:yes stop_codon:yes gene_type:complete
MERYEFEDQISDYIENNLSIKKRKIFLQYLEDNDGAKNLVDEIKNNIKKLNSAPKLVTGIDFNDRIINTIKNKKLNPESNKINDKKRFLGFTYLQSGLMFSFILLFGLIGQYLLFNENRLKNSLPYYTTMKDNSIKQSISQNDYSSSQKLVDTNKDTLQKNKKNNSYKRDFNKIKLVKN